MSVLYPRECTLCHRIYLDAQTFYRHRVRGTCARTAAKNSITVIRQQQEQQEPSNAPVILLEDQQVDPQPEVYYQRILEQRYQGSHLTTSAGITDITTNNMHIEIKRAANWLDGFRQLLAYNVVENRPNLRLYLFDYASLSRRGREKMMKSIRKGSIMPIDIYVLDNGGDERMLFDSQLYWS